MLHFLFLEAAAFDEAFDGAALFDGAFLDAAAALAGARLVAAAFDGAFLPFFLRASFALLPYPVRNFIGRLYVHFLNRLTDELLLFHVLQQIEDMMELPGKRKLGRPKRRFMDLVKEDSDGGGYS